MVKNQTIQYKDAQAEIARRKADPKGNPQTEAEFDAWLGIGTKKSDKYDTAFYRKHYTAAEIAELRADDAREEDERDDDADVDDVREMYMMMNAAKKF